MPSGRTRNLINVTTYGALALAAAFAVRGGYWPAAYPLTPLTALNFSWAFFAGTFLLSPDLDLAEGRVDSKRRWGPLGALWVPYGRMFSHRGLSHTWLLGPLTRLAYLAFWAALFFLVWRMVAPHLGLTSVGLTSVGLTSPVWKVPQPFPYKVILPVVVGYYLSQWLHLLADGIVPDHGLRHRHRKRR